jgi:hypothetical protein
MDRSDLGQDGLDFELRTVRADLVFTAGTSGAVPAALTFAKGIKSVVLTSTEYLITFQNVFAAFLGVTATVLQATPSASTAQYGEPTTVNIGKASTSPNTLGITFKKGSDGTAAALSTGDTVYINIKLKR